MNRCLLCFCLVLFFFSLLMTDFLFAQNSTSVAATNTSSPVIVVTASRQPKEINSVPNVVHRIGVGEKIEQESIRTTPGIIDGLPSVLFQKTSYGQGSPFLRGFTGFRTLFLIDGIKLNNSVFREGPNQYWNTVDQYSISTGELVMGAGSVLYGSDAVGGTFNVLSLVPSFPSEVPSWNSKLHYRYSTAEDSNIGRIQAGLSPLKELSFIGGVTVKDFGDLEGGKKVGRQPHTGYDETDYDFRADYHPNENSLLTFCLQNLEQDDVWRTHRTIYGITWKGLSRGDDKVHSFDQRRNLSYIKYKTDIESGLFDGLEVSLSHHAQEEDLYRKKKDDKIELQGFDVETWGTSVKLSSDSMIGSIVCGVDYYRDNVDSYLEKYRSDGFLEKFEIQGPVADDSTYESAGIYLEDTISVKDGLFDIVPGMRYDYSRADAEKVKNPLDGKQFSLVDDWNVVAGSLRVLVPLSANRDHVIFAGVAQGFRAPNLSDLTRYDIARSGELEVPSPDLKPEKYLSSEIGMKSRFSDLKLKACAYHTIIDEMIIRVPTGDKAGDYLEVIKKNSGEGYIDGAEIMAEYSLSKMFSVSAALSTMYGEIDTYPSSKAEMQRDYISRLMPSTAKYTARLQQPLRRWWLEFQVVSADKADKLSADDKRDTQRIPAGGTPAYTVCHLKGGMIIRSDVVISASVENIFDKDYRIHGSGVNEAGRNFIVAVTCGF